MLAQIDGQGGRWGRHAGGREIAFGLGEQVDGRGHEGRQDLRSRLAHRRQGFGMRGEPAADGEPRRRPAGAGGVTSLGAPSRSSPSDTDRPAAPLR